jgi:hypothetical protein
MPSHDRAEMASFFDSRKTTLRICKVSSLGSRLKLWAIRHMVL